MTNTYLVKINEYPDFLPSCVLKEFIVNFVMENEISLLKRVSDIYVYITDDKALNLTRQQRSCLNSNGFMVVGFMLFHKNKDTYYDYIERNSFLETYGSRIKGSDFRLCMIEEYEKTLDCPIKYTIPLNITSDEVDFWKDYFRSTFAIESKEDFNNFMSERRVEAEGGNWDYLDLLFTEE